MITTRQSLLSWASKLNLTLPVNRSNTCYPTSVRMSEELKRMRVKHSVVLAEGAGNWPHWFIRIDRKGLNGLLIDLTACQFNAQFYPMICFGTYEELTQRFGEQYHWQVIGTSEDIDKPRWQRRHGYS